MYDFCFVFSIVASVIAVVLMVTFFMLLIYACCVSYSGMVRKDGISLVVFTLMCFAGVICLNTGAYVWTAVFGILSMTVLVYLAIKFGKKDASVWISSVLAYLFMWVFFVCGRCYANYCEQYKWEHAEIYTVVDVYDLIEKEDEHDIATDGAIIWIGKCDVVNRYVRLSNGKSYCIEQQKDGQKNVYHKIVTDSVHVFRGQILE